MLIYVETKPNVFGVPDLLVRSAALLFSERSQECSLFSYLHSWDLDIT